MSFKELFLEEEFKTVFEEIEQFSEEMLVDYNEHLKSCSFVVSNKEIFDAVWGNIEFSCGEIYILDSPLLQRLRKIKQLGLAYFVYCGCDYSRFYHTLGVTYLANRMAEAINRCELRTSEQEKNFFKAVVRLAAIFHDVGHMFLSHVSEHYFSKSPSYPGNDMIIRLMNKFEEKAGKKAALHELLSCMLVNTKAVRELLEITVPHIEGLKMRERPFGMEELVEYISALIVGVPVDRKILPYSCIVNGPIDADKCDYLSRDSHVTRVPVAVDISRITQKLSVVESRDICMSELWHQDADTDVVCYELAMQDSAEKALFQLCIARTIMYDSVYYHHKVLTVETEFRNLLNSLANLQKPYFINFLEILRHTDEDFNFYFFENLKCEREEEDCKQIDKIRREFAKLYRRNIPKRVVCLTPDFITGTQKATETFWDTVMTTMDSSGTRDFIDKIKQEYIKVQKMLRNIDLNAEDVQIFAVQAPAQVFGHSKIQVPIDLRNGNKRDFRGYELVSSRETSSSSSYIVTDEDDRAQVYIAVEKTFKKQYNIGLKMEAISCGKYNVKYIEKQKMQLFKQGYYDDTPGLIGNTLLYNSIPESYVNKIVEKFSTYEGVGGHTITKEGVENFLKQLMCVCTDKAKLKSLLLGVCNLLENATFINREYLTRNLKSFVQMKQKNEKLYIVPLGSLADSAKHITYFWNDVKGLGLEIETEKSLQELLQMEECDTITFFDDGSYSGTQLVSIMQEYMGIQNRKTQEIHVKELPDDCKEILKQKSLCFFFIAYNKSKEAEMRCELGKIGMEKVDFFCFEDMSIRQLEENGAFTSEEQRKIVKEILQEVGFSVITSTKQIDGKYKKGWNEERASKAALGYNDAQQMVILKSSIPTYTISAFWAEGNYKNFAWQPLFKRTKK